MSRHALVVGVSNYHKDRGLQNLPAATADLKAITRVLEEHGDFTVTPLLNPAKADIERGLEDLFQNRTTGDTVLVYFSGHGLTDDDRNGLYLAAKDTEQERLSSSAVDSGLLGTHCNNTGASAKIVILDCCFAAMAGDGLRRRSGAKVPLKRIRQNGTVLLTATSRREASFEDTKAPDRPAFFTRAVVEGLTGGARDADGDGWISIQDLAEHVQNADGLRDKQRPHFFADGVTGAIPLTRVSGAPPVTAETPTIICGIPQPEPAHHPAAPMDAPTWGNLLRYYAACLRYEAGMDEWIGIGDQRRYKAWPGGPEEVITGIGKPFLPTSEINDFMTRNRGQDAAFHYGYPVAVDKKDRRFAPLITARVVPFGDAYIVEDLSLNTALLESLGLEPPEIQQLSEGFTANFRYTDQTALKAQIDRIVEVAKLATPDEMDPSALATELKTSPLQDGLQNLAVISVASQAPNMIKGLLKELEKNIPEAIPKLKDTALGALMRRETGAIARYDTLVAPGPLNESQEEVINAAMTRRLTVATGPPGTGKTALVTALTATAVANGQSILIGSSNHEAVDGVLNKGNAIVDGILIRTGKREITDAEPARLAELLGQRAAPGDPNLLAGTVRALHGQTAKGRAVLDERRAIEADLLAVHERLAVLLARANEAMRELTRSPKAEGMAIRARRSLRRFPTGLLSRFLLGRSPGVRTVAERQLLTELLETELRRRELMDALAGLDDENAVWKGLKQLGGQIRDASGALTKAHVGRLIQGGRAVIEQRIATMKSGGSSWKGFGPLLRALPGWAVNGHGSGALQPTPGLFDLVVIDEAAQCPVPVVLSLLMRAKRALIIGDPHQIPPVVTLNKDEDAMLRRRHKLGKEWMESRNLTYTGGSIYEACATAAGEVFLLDEHFRCDPAIVEVPNRVVYGGRLAVLTDVSRLALPATVDEPAVRVIDHEGGVVGKVNLSEANRVVELIGELQARHPDTSIGVVTPFRNQVTRIRKLLDAAGLKAKVDTAHKFQGDERDIIILSPVASEGIKPQTAQWAAGGINLWNVAITRAKSRLYVVCDRKWWMNTKSLLTDVLQAADASLTPENDDLKAHVDALQKAFLNEGLELLARESRAGGQRVQLVVMVNGRPTAIVVDAEETANGRKYRQLLAKLDLIADAGHEVLRVPAWRCLAEPEAVAAELVRRS